MLREYLFKQVSDDEIKKQFLFDWSFKENKVFVFRSDIEGSEARDFYEAFFSQIGKFLNYAEDGRESDRNKGRTGEVWMEIRNDSSIQNAYRHSTAAQPLHTDGSYIPGFPTSVLICESNVAKGGETIFVSISDILQSLESYDNDLYKFVTTEPITHARSGEKRTERIFYVENGVEKVNFNYFCVSENSTERVKTYSKALLDFLNLVEQGKTNIDILKVKLERGDAVIWKDDEIMHGRHAFTALENSERLIHKAAYQPNF